MIKNVKKQVNNQRGLTLIELLAVIVILGIIAAIAIPSIGSIIAKSKFDASKADAIQVLNATKIYMTETGNTNEDNITPEKLGTYVSEVKNITSWTVKVDAGVPKITATTVNSKKDGTKHTWKDAPLSVVEETKFDDK